jgi:hypothetical protein
MTMRKGRDSADCYHQHSIHIHIHNHHTVHTIHYYDTVHIYINTNENTGMHAIEATIYTDTD